jgi:APA family basic amino acid/polyamine antiporter
MKERGFLRELGLFDSVMVVIGVMIGSGIFIVPADMARTIGSPGWMVIAWVVTGILTVAAATSYGELASMMPEAGGMYVYLREAFSPVLGFLYGWTLFTVIQTGTIAAVAVAFGRFLGVLVPAISETSYLIPPIRLSDSYAVSLSSSQVVAIGVIALLTWTNSRGVRYGKIVQNLFTVAKIGSLAALILLGLFVTSNHEAIAANFNHFWDVNSGLTAFGLFVAVCVSQSGSLFSADSWHDITFAGSEVKDPRRTLPRALILGTTAVVVLYVLANLAYLATLPLSAIQNAPSDRVATAMVRVVSPDFGAAVIAIAIMVSTFGCVNSLVLAGPRVYYTMAQNGLFFQSVGRLNDARVPARSLWVQGLWAAILVLPRTYNAATASYGNLYSNLLDYVISAALIFYILTIAAVFRLRWTRPDAERPYRTYGYPIVPALYTVGAGAILICLFVYRPATTWPGLAIVAAGLPVYWLTRITPAAKAVEERT